MLGDIVSQAERMIAGEGLGLGDIAFFESFDDIEVIDDGFAGAIVAAGGDLPDTRRHEISVISARTAKPLSSMMVWWRQMSSRRIFMRVIGGLMLVVELVENGAQAGDFAVAGALADQAHSHAFQRCPGLDHLDHFALGLLQNDDAAPGQD